MVHNIFQQGNMAYAMYSQMPEDKRPANPPVVQINESQMGKVPDTLKPIWKELEGFTSVPPTGEAALTTVVAAVTAPKESLGSRP